jgi:hypothetical protein
MDETDREFIKKFGGAGASAPVHDEVDRAFIEQHAPVATAAAAEKARKGVWAPDVPIQSADEPFYLLGAELGLPYAAGRAMLGAAARYGGGAAAKFLTGQAGKGLLGRLPSLATSGAWQGALTGGIDKFAGAEGPDLGTGAGLGASVNALTGTVAAPFVNRIAPATARLAQRYMAQGIPLRTNQIEGASTAASLAGQLKRFPVALLHKFANMSDEGAKKLSKSLMSAMGSDEEQISMAAVKQGQAEIQQRARTALQQNDQAGYKLAQNQWVNSKILEENPRIWNETTGTVNPSGLYSVINSRAAGYGGVGKASAAAGAAANPFDIGTLAEGAKTFSPQTPNVRGLASGVVSAGGLLGFGELEGLPLIETLGHHPAATSAALGALGGVGALQNSQPYTNWLLSRAASGAGPLLAGSNPLIPAYLATRGDSGAPAAPTDNWSKWLKAQSFLESPSGAPSEQSSAKGYFQFIDGTAKKATDAGLPNPQRGNYAQQADATKQYIQRFYPEAAAAIESGDYSTAVSHLRGEWPSLPGGSQQQGTNQYRLWNSILSGEDLSRPRIEVHPEAQQVSNSLSGSQ